MPALGNQDGDWIEATLSKPVSFDHLDLQVVADGEHSIPSSITITTSSGSRTVTLPDIASGTGRPEGSVTPVTVNFPALSGSDVRVTINSVRTHTFFDYYGYAPNTDPVGLAEVGIPGAAPETTPTAVPVHCYSNLLSIDGRPIDIAISGPTATALSNDALTIHGCGDSANGITLAAGRHTVHTSGFSTAGLDIDALTMGSAAGGAALPSPRPSRQSPSPAVTVLHQDRTSLTLAVKGTGKSFWLVLGQSQSRGWTATTASGTELGTSTLIDGYANGWFVPGSLATAATTITLSWTPQRVVNAALLASGATLLVSLVLIALPSDFGASRGRRRRRHVDDVSALPELISSLRSEGATPSWTTSVGIALAGGLAAAVFVAPLAGLLIGAVTLFEAREPRLRSIVLGGAIGCLLAMAGYVVVGQHSNRFVSDISWPAHFGVANSLVWIALFLFAADAVVQWARHRIGDESADTE